MSQRGQPAQSQITICDVPGASKTEVERVAAWREIPIRAMSLEAFGKAAADVIDYVSSAYCGTSDAATMTAVYDECAYLLRQKFGHFAAEEVREAFRMAAANRIEADLTAYGGRFTVAMFGDVLTAYAKHRAKIVAALEAQKAAQAEAFRLEKRREHGRLMLEKFLAEFEQLRNENDRFAWWQDIPAGTDEALKNRGVFDAVSKSDKAFWWLEAKREAVRELRDLEGAGADLQWAARIVRWCECNPDQFPPELMPRATVIYGKMLAFSLLAPYRQTPEMA